VTPTPAMREPTPAEREKARHVLAHLNGLHTTSVGNAELVARALAEHADEMKERAAALADAEAARLRAIRICNGEEVSRADLVAFGAEAYSFQNLAARIRALEPGEGTT
jgi:hypothetical protein